MKPINTVVICFYHINVINIIILQGLKTGMYYLRSKPAVNAIQFTVDKKALKEVNQSAPSVEELKEKQMADVVCSLTNREACISCSG